MTPAVGSIHSALDLETPIRERALRYIFETCYTATDEIDPKMYATLYNVSVIQ